MKRLKMLVPGLAALAAVVMTAAAFSIAHGHARAVTAPAVALPRSSGAAAASGIHKVKHVVVIMQENRSFDSYFGTFPGANGIPSRNGAPTVCSPDPRTGKCVRPYHDSSDVNGGGSHNGKSAIADLANGKMNGFQAQAEIKAGCGKNGALANPNCSQTATPDPMGYHDAREVPNYWQYAQHYVLDDRMFEPNRSWSFAAHLYMVSGWSAQCTKLGDPSSCVTN